MWVLSIVFYFFIKGIGGEVSAVGPENSAEFINFNFGKKGRVFKRLKHRAEKAVRERLRPLTRRRKKFRADNYLKL